MTLNKKTYNTIEMLVGLACVTVGLFGAASTLVLMFPSVAMMPFLIAGMIIGVVAVVVVNALL